MNFPDVVKLSAQGLYHVTRASESAKGDRVRTGENFSPHQLTQNFLNFVQELALIICT
jgi:hypothetical protein